MESPSILQYGGKMDKSQSDKEVEACHMSRKIRPGAQPDHPKKNVVPIHVSLQRS